MRDILRHASLAGLLLSLCAAGCQDQQNLSLGPNSAHDPQSLAARLFFADACRDVANKSAITRELLRAVNNERAKAKLPPLRANDTLNQLAEFYACRLIEGDFFDHTDPFDGSTVDRRASNFGYPFLKIGENLAAGQRDIDQTVAEWMNSPGHKANILDAAFTELGVAVKEGGKNTPCWVLEFGRPITAGEEPTSNNATVTTSSSTSAATSRTSE